MLITLTSPSFLKELRKALDPNAPAPPPPTSGGGNEGGGAKPQPEGQPRAGHKYIKREWSGTKWEYTYPDEVSPESHGPLAMGDHKTRGHSIDMHPSAEEHAADPEKAYHASMQAHMREHGAVHQLPNPTGGEPLQAQIYVSNQGTPKIVVSNAAGKVKEFANRGSLEAWWRGSQQPIIKLADVDGKPWLSIVPNLGQVQGDVLRPSTDPLKQYKIVFDPGGNPELQRLVGGDAKDLKKPSLESCIEQVEKWRRLHSTLRQVPYKPHSGLQGLLGKGAPAAPQAPMAEGAATQPDLQATTIPGTPTIAKPLLPEEEDVVADMAAAPQPEYPVVPGSADELMRSGRRPDGLPLWVLDEQQRPHLNLNDDDRHVLASKVVSEFWVPVVRTARRFLQSHPKYSRNPDYWLPKLLGVDIAEIERTREQRSKPAPYMDENAPIIEAIASGVLDKYDPTRTDHLGRQLGLAAWLIGGKKGRNMLTWAMRDAMDKLHHTEGQAVSAYVDSDTGAQKEVYETVSPKQGQREEDSTSPELGTFESWQHDSINALSSAQIAVESGQIQFPAPYNKNPAETMRRIASALQKVKDPESMDQFAGVMRHLGLQDYLIDMDDVGEEFSFGNEAKDYIGREKIEMPERKPEKVEMPPEGELVPAKHKQIPPSQGRRPLLRRPGKPGDDIKRSLSKAVYLLKQELRKAGTVPSEHAYSHMQGDKDHAQYYYKDPVGNFVRYTNAPDGHGDASKLHGDAEAVLEPDMASAPQFFAPDGRKLTRASHPMAQVQWNPNYHAEDPNNLWIGRWVNPESGEHEYTYVDADVRMHPKLHKHYEVLLVDSKLPLLRSKIQTMFSSPQLKDKIAAAALALLDQGATPLLDLTSLTPAAVKSYGPLIAVGSKMIFADAYLRQVLETLHMHRTPNEPLFAVPQIDVSGQLMPMIMRRIGPHYIRRLLATLDLTPESLLMYRASQIFLEAYQLHLNDGPNSSLAAKISGLYAVAAALGYAAISDVDRELPIIEQLYVDPVILEVLEAEARSGQLFIDDVDRLPVGDEEPYIPHVQLNLNGRTQEEQKFSDWLHKHPMHQVAEEAQVPA